MKLLVDTHAVIWAADDPSKLGARAVTALQDPGNDLFLSAGTIWEIAIKVGLGKLSLSMSYREWMNQAITDLGMTVLPVTVEYAESQGNLPRHHGDPFDRLLVAQAQVENMTLISADPGFDPYAITRLW